MSTYSFALASPPPAKTASWVDRVLDGLFRWLDASLVQQAAGELARECRDSVWAHIRERTCGMGRAQARGYVSAVAPDFLAREVDVVLNRHRAGAQLRPHVMADALEQVVEMVAEDVAQARPRKVVRGVAA